MKTKFKYGDKVKIIDGFWNGYEGLVNDCREEDMYSETEYEIYINITKEDIRDEWIKESYLEK